MRSPMLDEARAYLDALETDRKAALGLSEQKAEEAKLIKARQEGFQAAIEILGSGISVRRAEANPKVKQPVGSAAADHKFNEPMKRRGRRRIRQLIVRELSLSGQAMTVNQVAEAIKYNPAGTAKALQRMEAAGQVLRDEHGR